MIKFEFEESQIGIDELWGLSIADFLDRFPQSRAVYSKTPFCDVSVDCSCSFGKTSPFVSLLFNHGQLYEICIKWHHGDKLGFMQRRHITRATIQSIKKTVGSGLRKTICFLGNPKWKVGNYSLAYRFYERFGWEEELKIKRK